MKPIALLIALALAFPAQAKTERNRYEKAKFRYSHPCPATGQRTGRCPGWIVDHIIPLCGGGPDKATNMQWQPEAESHRKDAKEVHWCKCLDHWPRQACTALEPWK